MTRSVWAEGAEGAVLRPTPVSLAAPSEVELRSLRTLSLHGKATEAIRKLAGRSAWGLLPLHPRHLPVHHQQRHQPRHQHSLPHQTVHTPRSRTKIVRAKKLTRMVTQPGSMPNWSVHLRLERIVVDAEVSLMLGAMALVPSNCVGLRLTGLLLLGHSHRRMF